MSTRVFRLVALSAVLSAAIFAPAVSPAVENSPTPGGRMAAVLQPFVDRHQLAGAVVLVADKDKVLDVETVGYADVAAKKPMRPDSLFWIASQSKPIVAAAVLMLADEGKLKLDDPVEKYLPEFHGQMVIVHRDDNNMRLRKPKHPMTIRNLLSHASGLPANSPVDLPAMDALTLGYRTRIYGLLPLEYEPGTANIYSNPGINSAGRIVEVASGMPYEKFLDERLLRPLGMNDTTFWPAGDRLARLAKPYLPSNNKDGLGECGIWLLTYPLDSRQRQSLPCGGLFSTAGDIARFFRMIAAGGVFEGKRILSEKAVREMGTPQPGNPGYGLGMSINGDRIGHGGLYLTDATIDRKHGLVMVFMVQHSGWPAGGDACLGAFQKAALESFGKK